MVVFSLRNSAESLERKRRKKAICPNLIASPDLAIFCKNDDTLMIPAWKKVSQRSSQVIRIYFCPKCSNEINPEFEPAIHAMAIQTSDKAIRYPGKRKTIASIPMRSYRAVKDEEFSRFLKDSTQEDLYTKVLKRTIVKQGQTFFKLK